MPTIDFDWGRFNDSQWFGYPKNGNWAKYPQWEDDVVSSNHEAYSAEVHELKVHTHCFKGYKSDVYFDAAGDCGDAVWMDHLEEKVDIYFMTAPTIVEEDPTSGTEDEVYAIFTFEATGSTPITWSVSDGDLPAGMTLDEETGILGGTPTEAGEFAFTVTATNAKGSDDYETSITIEAAG